MKDYAQGSSAFTNIVHMQTQPSNKRYEQAHTRLNRAEGDTENVILYWKVVDIPKNR